MTKREAFLKAIDLINELKPDAAMKMYIANQIGDHEGHVKWASRLGGYIDVCERLYEESLKP